MNYMNNYPYNNYQYQYVPTMMQPQQYISQINGKVVDGIDVVKATEVPSNGYGVFPKADLSEIYVKSWNNNGTTNIITFKPIVSENAETTQIDIVKLIEDKFNQLETKIDNLKKKESKANEY